MSLKAKSSKSQDVRQNLEEFRGIAGKSSRMLAKLPEVPDSSKFRIPGILQEAIPSSCRSATRPDRGTQLLLASAYFVLEGEGTRKGQSCGEELGRKIRPEAKLGGGVCERRVERTPLKYAALGFFHDRGFSPDGANFIKRRGPLSLSLALSPRLPFATSRLMLIALVPGSFHKISRVSTTVMVHSSVIGPARGEVEIFGE
ncbi:hypothetical protein KM043_010718 [Ampulex compressa]|nr:hypothetical protein KM043_010718 [Ampulex compressa]